MKFILIFLGFVCVLHANPRTEHLRLWEIARTQNPSLRTMDAEILAAKARATRSQILFPSNPELELSTRRGTLRTGVVLDPGFEGPLQKERQKTTGYEVGISQEFEVAGQRGLRMESSSIELESLISRKNAHLREVYFGIRRELLTLDVQSRLIKVLDDQIASVSQLEWQFRMNGVRDTKLGVYVFDAIQADLALLRVERSNATQDRQVSIGNLKGLVGTPVTASDFGSFAELDLLPQSPDEGQVLQTLSPENPFFKENLALAKKAGVEIELARRSIYPNVTAFIGAGVDRRGNGTALAFPPISSGPQSESERFIRAGVRIPIPVFNRGQGLEDGARAELAKVTTNVEVTRLQMEIRVRSLLSRYTQARANLDNISQQVAKRTTIYWRLDQAFLSGRMSYSEYWTERSKWMTMERDLNRALLDAIEARSGVEILSGIDFATGKPVELETAK
ncbi:MAG: TolC family protein [Leptospirales bacterium]|nr:TolC family protein [Leptospirales bacterium]